MCATALQIKVFILGLLGGTLRDQHCQESYAVTLHPFSKVQENVEFMFLYPIDHPRD